MVGAGSRLMRPRLALVNGGLLVDIRPEAQRRAEGEPVGSIVIERNVLEWRLDPQSPNRLPIITGHDQVIVVICSEGYASSFAAATLRQLGLHRATDVVGGFAGVARGRAAERRHAGLSTGQGSDFVSRDLADTLTGTVAPSLDDGRADSPPEQT